KITPPGGSWDLADNGSYTVALEASQVSDTSGNFAAAGTLEIVKATSRETTPPTASGTFGNVTTAGATSYTLTGTYSDQAAISVSRLDWSDVRITGPNGFNVLAALQSVDENTNGTPRVATYKITPPGGSWDFADNGSYTVALEASQVSDTSGNFAAAGTLGTFQATIPDTTPPTASGTI